MDPRLLHLYSRELQYVREAGEEFAREYPKVAGRLGLDGPDCADPYVERLIESFAFLTARIQLKLEAQFPRFTQHLLESVFPGYLAPMPSMAVVQLRSGVNDAAQLESGYVLPRGSALRGGLGAGLQTASEFRTTQATTLWPLEVKQAIYQEGSGEFAPAAGRLTAPVQATLRLRLAGLGGVKLSALHVRKLAIFLHGPPELTGRLHEQLTTKVVGALGRGAGGRDPWQVALPSFAVRPAGLEDEEAALPINRRAFQGHRLLHEYFAMPAKFLFVELDGLEPAFRRCTDGELEVVLLLGGFDRSLAGAIAAAQFRLFCVPAINLFPLTADRIQLTEGASELLVVPDHSRPRDFEVYAVERVTGYSPGNKAPREFLPLYSPIGGGARGEQRAYFAMRRDQRAAPSGGSGEGLRTGYAGSDVYLSLVDGEEGPFGSDLEQLSVQALCTNQALPTLMPLGVGRTDFHLPAGAPVEEVRCLVGPTEPRPAAPAGELSWRLIDHLALNHRSIGEEATGGDVSALKAALELYADLGDPTTRRQIDGLVTVVARPAIHRIPLPGPIAFVRGIEVTLTLDERAFEGVGVLRVGQVLERFFTRYASINTTAETVLKTVQRGEIKRWRPRAGTQQAL